MTLEHKLGDITSSRIINYIVSASNLKKFTLAESILNLYRTFLNKDTYFFGCSIIEFYQGLYLESINSIEQISQKYKSQRLVYRQLILGCYFLLGELDFVSSFVHSTRQSLERNQNNLPEHASTPAKTYLKYFHKILKIRQQKEATSRSYYQESLQKLKEEIQAIDKILSRNQLIFIIEKLLEQ